MSSLVLVTIKHFISNFPLLDTYPMISASQLAKLTADYKDNLYLTFQTQQNAVATNAL